MATDDVKLKISRSKWIESSRDYAILRLDTGINHMTGQPVMVRYYTDDSQETVNVIFAIGINNGKGHDCYKVVSFGQNIEVWGVGSELPTADMLAHNELYLYFNTDDGTWNFVYLSGDDRKIVPLENDNESIFYDLSTGYRWFSLNGKVKREDDFYTRAEIDSLLRNLDLNGVSDGNGYLGNWNAEENIPTLSASDEVNNGDYYFVTNDGTRFDQDFKAGDLCLWSDGKWNRILGNNSVSQSSGSTGAGKVLVKPVISGTWTIYGNDNSEIRTYEGNTLELEYGFKASFNGTYHWTHEEGKLDPEYTNGFFGATMLTSGEESTSVRSSVQSTNYTITQNLEANKVGLELGSDGKTIVEATGRTKTSSSVSLVFKHRVFWGNVDNKVLSAVSVLPSNELRTDFRKEITGITTASDEYFCIAYPSSLGRLSKIVYNGAAPVLDDFEQPTEIEITNASGAQIRYYYYVSKNPGAFNNSILAFS